MIPPPSSLFCDLPAPETIAELLDRHAAWARQRYPEPTPDYPSTEWKNFKHATDPLREIAGALPLDQMNADILAIYQQHQNVKGWKRKYLNAQVNRVRRVFRWAAKPPRRWVPMTLLEDLKLVDALRPGETVQPEPPRVKPAPPEAIKALLEAIALEAIEAPQAQAEFRGRWALHLATLIEVQYYTGCRPAEACYVERGDLAEEMTIYGPTLVYRPPRHKKRYRGEERIIDFGEEGERLLRAWMRRVPPDQPRLFHYRRASYTKTLEKVCQRHGIAKITANMIRHTYGTRMRSLVGLEMTSLLMGHTNVETTKVYAEPDRAQALEIQRRFN